MNELIDQGIAKGLIAFDTDQKNINYKIQNKRLRFNDPEEKVRANAYPWCWNAATSPSRSIAY